MGKLFVSRYSHLRIPILHEKKKFLGQNAYGNSEWEIEIPHFTAEFLPMIEGGPAVKYADRLAAYQHFAGPNGKLHYGSANREPGISQEVGGYEGSTEEYLLGAFDVDHQNCVSAELSEYRELIEARLSEVCEESNGSDFIVIGPEALKPPWPNYEKIDGRSFDKALEFAEQGGISLHDCLAFERAREKPRESWVKGWEQAITERADAEREQAALQVTIGG